MAVMYSVFQYMVILPSSHACLEKWEGCILVSSSEYRALVFEKNDTTLKLFLLVFIFKTLIFLTLHVEMDLWMYLKLEQTAEEA